MTDDQTALGSPPADAQGDARAEIDRLMADPAFREGYDDRHHLQHAGAVSQMEKLASAAWPGETEIAGIDYDAGRADEEAQQQPAIPRTEAEWEADDKLVLENVSRELRERHGADWESKVSAARAMLKTAVGDQAFAAVVVEAGNDPDLISELVGLSEMDPSGLLGAFLRENLAAGLVYDRAEFEIEKLHADPEWRQASEGLGRARDVALARMTALHILKSPPKAIVKALQGLQR